MSRQLMSLVLALALSASATLIAGPAASAAHNCAIEDYSWSGIGEEAMNAVIIMADQACDGAHGHACDGKYLDYGWFGICI